MAKFGLGSPKGVQGKEGALSHSLSLSQILCDNGSGNGWRAEPSQFGKQYFTLRA
jgi:hypothetical protein